MSSDRRCPRDGKLMMVEIGNDAADVGGHGWVEMVHQCWDCGYTEEDRAWKRPRIVKVLAPSRSGLTAAERLYRLRDGTFQEVFDGA